MRILVLSLAIFFMLFSSSYADLTPSQVNRFEAAKELLETSDTRPVEKIIKEMNSSNYIGGAVMIFEAVAFTYDELIRKYELEDMEAQKRLLEKIRMNMAYFQLGDQDDERRGKKGLNVIIRRTLKKYLPSELMENPRLFYSLEE